MTSKTKYEMKFIDDDEDNSLGDEIKLLNSYSADAKAPSKPDEPQSDGLNKEPVIITSKISYDPAVRPQKKHNVNFTIADSKSMIPVLDFLNKIKKDVSRQNVENKSFEKKSSFFNFRCGFFSDNKKPFELKKIRTNLYNFLEQPIGLFGLLYRLFRFTIIIGSIICGTLTTYSSMDKWSLKLLYWYEIFATTYFATEFCIRVWSSGHRANYKGINGYIKYLRRPMRVIELCVIIISISVLIFGSIVPYRNKSSEGPYDEHFNPNALLLLRFFQILRFLYIDSRAQTWQLVLNTVKKHRFELITSAYIGTILLLFSSYLILIFEKPISDQMGDKHFHTFADAMYWSIITMATVGYGDRSPRSFAGKIIATTLCVVGIAFWTLPGGIIGSGFALKVEQKNKKKQFNRLVPAAASLIQAWWRMKATMYLSSSSASSLLATVKTFDVSKPIYSESLRKLQQSLDDNCIELNSYFSSIDKPAAEYGPVNDKIKDQFRKNTSYISQTDKNQFTVQSTIYSTLGLDPNDLGTAQMLLELSPEHLIIIRLVLMLKFYVAKTKFKHAFKPYDFKDVIEQYTQGNMDILLKMKDLQRKIEQVSINIPNNHFNRHLSLDCQSCNDEKISSKFYTNEYEPEVFKNASISSKSPTKETKRHSVVDKNKRLLSPFSDRKSTLFEFPSNSNSLLKSDQKTDNRQLFDRIRTIELNLESLQKKMEILIELSTRNAIIESR